MLRTSNLPEAYSLTSDFAPWENKIGQGEMLHPKQNFRTKGRQDYYREHMVL